VSFITLVDCSYIYKKDMFKLNRIIIYFNMTFVVYHLELLCTSIFLWSLLLIYTTLLL